MDSRMQRASRMDMAILPDPTVPGGRILQQQKAKEMARATEETSRRHGLPVPEYEFLELIGKGSFGRVYKCRSKKKSSLVAVKVMEVDREDFKLDFNSRDAQLVDITNEIKILQTLKDSNAKNVNILHEAFAFHSQLWLVSEYCPGGSLQTLMKVRNNLGFEERYIITICRELAVALKHVHDMGIIHRDVKAANILITQDGGLQLCDFGVSGILEPGSAKRSTIIGTPFWMPPEMHTGPDISEGYGTEIDCWAFGCTAYELATGQPPNARIDPSKLHLFLRKAPRLEGADYSDTLKEFVAYSLVAEPKMRPTAEQILKHPYLAGTERDYPTTILRELIERFANWERQGGQRASLFNAHGAGGPGTLASFIGADDDWNFSTTDDFELQGQTSFLAPSTPLTAKHIDEEEVTPRMNNAPHHNVTPFEKAKEEQRIARGGQMMERLFNPNPLAAEYSFGQQQPPHESSDLPFRRDYLISDDERKSIIDLDAGADDGSVDLGDVPTIKPSQVNRFYEDDGDDEEEEETDDSRYQYWNADERNNRRTRDWKFPAATMPAAETARPRTIDWSMEVATAEAKSRTSSVDIIENIDPQDLPSDGGLGPPFRPKLIHTATEPFGSFGDHLHPASAAFGYNLSDRPASLIDLDEASIISRPSTAASSAGRSELSNGDPFDLAETSSAVLDEENDGLQTIRRRPERSSFHVHSQSEPTADRTSQGALVGNHIRDASNVTDSEFERQFSYSVRGTAESLRRDTAADDADEEWESATEQVPAPMMSNPLRQEESWGTLYNPRSHSRGRSTNEWGSYSDTASRDEGITLATKRVLSSRDTSSERTNISDDSTARPIGDTRLKAAAQALIGKFPEPIGPSAASLEEDAEPRVVAAEFERLLSDFMRGLSIAGALMKDEVAEYDDVMNSDMDSQHSSIR